MANNSAWSVPRWVLPRMIVLRLTLVIGLGCTASMAQEPVEGATEKLRDVLASAYLHPFLTDGDMQAYVTDTRGRVAAVGGVVTFCYPGIQQVLLKGTPLPVVRTGPNLIQVKMLAGVHDVEIVASPDKVVPDLPKGFAPADSTVSTADDLNARASAAKPGDELVVRNGNYVDWRVEITAKGTKERPILVRAETPGGAIFSRRTGITIKGDHVVLKGFRFENCSQGSVRIDGGSDNRITQCQFFYCGNPLSTFGHVVSVGMDSHRNRVDHCYFTGSRSMSLGQGVRSGEGVGTHNKFAHNVFRDVYRYWVNGQENIQIGQGKTSEQQTHCTVEYNLFDHAWGDSEIFSNKTSNNIHRWNVAAHCVLASFYLRGGHEVRVEGNIMVNNANGLVVLGKRHIIVNNLIMDQRQHGILLGTGHKDRKMTIATEGTLIAHNTIINCAVSGIGGPAPSERSPYPPKNNRIWNNIIVGSEGTLLNVENFVDSDIRRNLFWATGGAQVGVPGEGAITQDPRLVGSGLDIRPARDSAAVDRALPLEEIKRDRWDRSRPSGRGPDIGADEIEPGRQSPLPLPDIPMRPILAPDLYKRDVAFDYDPKAPMKGWASKEKSEVRDGQIVLTDSTIIARGKLPQEFVMEWDYHPEEYASAVALTFSTGDDGRGYTFVWGGAGKDGMPSGIISLRKTPLPKEEAKEKPKEKIAGDTREQIREKRRRKRASRRERGRRGSAADPFPGLGGIIAEGSDIVQYFANYRLRYNKVRNKSDKPAPNVWYRFTLVKRKGRIWLGLKHPRRMTRPPVPLFAWEDRGLLAGPSLHGSGLSIRQKGTGTWKNISVWTCGYTGDTPPPKPATFTATAKAPNRVALSWNPSKGQACTYDIHRSTDPDFAPNSDNRIARRLTGHRHEDFQVEPGKSYTYRVRAFNALGRASGYAAAQATPSAAGPQYIYVKANMAQHVESPLTLSRDRTSGRIFLWSTSDRYTDAPPDKGRAEYVFRISKKGEYHFWGRVIAPSGGEDSFYVSLDGVRNGECLAWHTGIHETWTWARMDALETVALSPGEHTIRFRPRDPGTKLSAILITDDLSYPGEQP